MTILPAVTGTVLSRPGVVAERGLTLPEGMSFDEWTAVGATLGRITRSLTFWIGDWLRYGERVYGEKYAQAMEVTGYDYGTLANAAYVAGQVEFSRRRENLSFGHHQAVAALAPAQQDYWLAAAAPGPEDEKPRLSVRELRESITVSNALPAPAGVAQPTPDMWCCGRFRHIIRYAQEAIDGACLPLSGADLIIIEAERIRERLKAEH